MDNRRIIEGLANEFWNGIANDLIEEDEIDEYLSEFEIDWRYRGFPEDLIEKAVEECREQFFEEEI